MFCTNCGKEIGIDSKFCTSCGQSIQNENPKLGKLIFHRVKSVYGCAIGIKIYVDGELIGTINNDGTIEHSVSIGNHKIGFSLWSGANQKEINVTDEFPNVYLDIKLKMGFLTTTPEIVNIRSEK